MIPRKEKELSYLSVLYVICPEMQLMLFPCADCESTSHKILWESAIIYTLAYKYIISLITIDLDTST